MADAREERQNGFEVKSLRDLVAVAVLVSMFLGVVAWGLKLESELNKVRDDLISVQVRVGAGILPRAEERIRSQGREIDQLEREIRRLEGLHDGNK